MAQIFLIDDHPAVRQGLKLLLAEESHFVCGEAGSNCEALERIGASGADIALLDISLGEDNGLELISELHEHGVSVLIYSMHEDAAMIERAFLAGAVGYVSKREGADILLAAASELLAGKNYVSPRAAQSLDSRVQNPGDMTQEALLSTREKQILAMLALGKSNPDIAAFFSISIRTVETYYARIIDKLDLNGMKELRQYALKSNLP